MNDDPIIAEVRKARDDYAKQFGYDLDAICNDLQMKQLLSGKKLVSFPPKRPNSRIEVGTLALAQTDGQCDPVMPNN